MAETLEEESKLEIIDPFEFEENLDWLELDKIPAKVFNPLLDLPVESEYTDPVKELVKVFRNPQYLHFACRHILNLEMLPFQLAILDTLWTKRLPILMAGRGSGKTWILAVYALLRMIFHPGCKVVVVGAAFRQSRQVFEYMTNIWEKAPILRDICGKSRMAGPRREIDRCQFSIGDSVCYVIPLGNGEKIRGLRGNYILSDEFSSIPEDIFNIVVQGFGAVASSPVDKVKEAAMIKKLKKAKLWNDDMQKLYNNKLGGNQIVYSGTAYYEFNHFTKILKKWHAIISSHGDIKKLKDIIGDINDDIFKGFSWTDYSILRIPYTVIPDGWLDKAIVAQAKTTLSHAQFLMEYCACPASDSDGFFKRSIIEAATTNKPILTQSGEYVQFSARRSGDSKKVYVLGVDPAADRDNAALVLIELHLDHRRVIACWTTNRTKYTKFKQYMLSLGVELGDDYYTYIAKRIRKFMREFNIECIIMDKNGGGTAIQEALSNKNTYEQGEAPVLEVIDPDDPKHSDTVSGVHILQMLAPTPDINSEANHGMLKDLQDKTLLFPVFDTIEIEKSIQVDKMNNIQFDTYEDLVLEIEELKNEMTTIVVSPSSNLGRETFNTPSIKGEGARKGRLRKDRYSALLYANHYARNKGKNEPMKIEYRAVGGSRDTVKKTVENESPYYGDGMARMMLKCKDKSWLSIPNFRYLKH